ncbi:MAG: filamentous hemagglutinin N-terminal domain-containing protein, partial [Methyloversatilis discipulorum]|uniref:two-partner secretion domain-containing protein n=1 Tax=Methyloversatilis discipulorum TaxID=1119528 RepID=UPI0026EEEAC6
MNKGRYRLVFSDEHRSYVPVPEETCARGKNSGGRALRRLVAAMAAALPGLVIANPTGHQIVQGQVGIQTQGSTLNITASDRAIINWKQFSIQPGETTRFIQPHSTATVLNRVVGQDPSQILGNLIANGRVFLINPNGVLFGAGAKVDTAGLVASTLNISNEDFTAGRLKFNAEGTAGKLRNEGTLKTTGGPLLLIATDIENTGLITADNGDIVLAAGKSVEIADPHQPALRVRVEAGGEAINLGQLIARGGTVGMFGAALTQAGKISATGAHRTADGRIVLRGSKSVTLTAQSETTAKSADGAGGDIDIAAPEVKVEAGARVEASGTQGGRIDIAATQKASVDGTLRATGTLPAAPAPAPTPASTAEDIELPATAAGPAPVTTPVETVGKGGQIEITADTVLVGGTATLDASGDTGGGSVLVGGDWQGGNPQVRNAQVSWIGGGARLLADALFEGDGGKVVVWADQATAFHGNIWARGGERGGNGGQVEVSGKVALLYRGRTDTSAARGRNGVLLLDPLAMVIQGGSGDGSNDGSLTFNGGAPGTLTAEALGPTVIYESEIEEQSKTTDIILRAQRSVTVGTSQFTYTGSGNAAGETSGQLTLAEGSSLLIETRNLGGEEGGPSAGIDLVTGGAHGASLRIVAQGDGSITMQTGYSNGIATGDQRADIIVPILTAGEGNILLRTVRGTGSTIQFRNAVTTGGTLQTSADTHTGSQHLQGDAGVSIDGDYIVDSGTLDIDAASAAISGMLFLSGTLDGNASLTLGGLVWYSGVITGTGAVTLTGNGELPQNYNYRYLDRELVIAGTLDLKNNYQLYVRNGGKLHLGSTGTLSSSTHDGNIYLTAGASGTATFGADAGARIEIATGRRINLYSDGNGGNQFSSRFELSGDGALALSSGNFTLTGDSVITGSGNLALSGADVGGSGNLDIGSNVVWTAGRMYGSGTTTFSGLASLPQATNNKVLQRRLDITGTLDLDNNYWLYVQNGGMLHVGSTGTVRTSSNDGNIYLNAGASGVANFSADDGAQFEVAAGRTLRLFSDNNAGNQFSAVLELGGAGTLALTSGSFTLQGDSSITGSGTLALSGGDLTGSGNLDIGSRVVWTAGGMSGTGTTTFSGIASLPQATSNKTLQRRLDITGTLDVDNNYWLYVQNGGTLHVSSTGTVRTAGNDGYIYLSAGASGVASFSTDDGATIEVAGERTLRLFSDGSAGNRLSAVFELGGAGTLALSSGNFTLLGDSSITGTGTLALSGADLSGGGNLDIASAVIWSAGRMSGTGTTTFSGAASLPQVTSNKFLQRRLDITGTLDLNNNYALYIQNGGTLHVASTGVLRTTTGDSHLYFDAGATGVTNFIADEGARIEVAAERTLRLYSDGQAGNQFSAHLDVTGEGTLSLNGGRFTLDGDSVIGGSGNYLLNLDLSGSGNITLRDNFTWSGGNMSGSGRTVLDTSVTLSGTRYIDRELVIAEDRTLLLNDNVVLRSSDSTNGGGRVTAIGTLAKGTGSGNAYLHYLDITGNIESRGGLLRLYGYSAGQGSSMGGALVSSLDAGGVLIESGTFHVTGSSLQIAADSALNFNAGTLNLNGGSVSGTGDFRMNGGTLNVNQNSVIGSRFTLSGGTQTGDADLTLSGSFEWAGGTMSGTGRTVLAGGTAGTIANVSANKFLHRRLDVAGTLNFANSNNYDLYIRDSGTLHITSTGTLTTTSNSFIYLNEGYNGSGNGIAALSSETGGRIAVADGTTLFINSDASAANRLRGNVELSGPGAVQINSGLITVDAATNLTGNGALRLNGGTLATDAATSIARLQITGGTLSGTATVTLGDLLWQSGTISGSGTAVLAGSGTIDSTSAYKYLHRRLVIDGTLTLANSTNYDLYIRDGGTLHIGATGTLATSANGYIYFNEGSNGSNNGIAALTSATGGRIAVMDGSTLFLTADSSATNLISGSFALAGPGALQINSGLITVDQSSAFTGAGLLRLNGGTLYAGAATSIANLDLFGGTLDGPATVTLNNLLWRSGSMAGTGTTVLSGTGTIDNTSAYRYLLRQLDVAGTLNIANSNNYDLYIRDGGTLNIGSTGRLTASTNAYINLNEGYNSSGNGQARLSAATGGRIAVAGGSTLFLTADSSTNNLLSGNFLLDGPGVVQLNSGALTTDLATQLSGPGVFRLAGGSLTASAALGIGNLELNGSSLTGSGDITVFDRFVWNSGSVAGSGVLTLAGNSTLASNTSYKDASREIRVSGNLTVTDQNGYGMRLNNARLAVLAGGILTLENDARITHTGTGRLDNAGLLVKRGPSALTLAMPLTNSGTLRVEESTLSATAFPVNDGQIVLVGGATLSTAANLTNNGSIAGRGTISVGAGTLTNAGLLQPGGDGAAGVIAIQGNFVQTSAGALEAELLGSTLAQQDQVQVSGTIALGGDLEIMPAEGVTLGAGNRYTVLSCSALDCLSGVFDTVDLNGLTATQNYFSNALSFANGTLASTWISTTSGFWDVAANWAGGLLPTSTTDVVIDQAGDLTITVRSTGGPFVVKSLYSNENISITGGALTLNEDSVINGRLSMSGGTLTVGSELELGALSMSGGTITGGRLIAAAGTYVMSGGTLNALEMQLGLRLSVSGTSYMQNVTVSRLGSGIDAGLVHIDNGQTMEARGTLTLDGA